MRCEDCLTELLTESDRVSQPLRRLPDAWHPGITQVSTFLIATALAAIGVQTDIGRLARSGPRPLALGFVLWVAVALVSLFLQHATGS